MTALTGTALVEASAGTGKTHAITSLFVRLLLEKKLSVSEIAVVTFTEAATAELRGRIRRRLRETIAALDNPSGDYDEDLRAIIGSVDAVEGRRIILHAISELDLASISTIHAFCLRALQERAFESGAPFGLQLAADTSDLVREVAEDYWSAWMVPMAPDLFRLASKTLSLTLTERLVRAIVRRPADIQVLPTTIPHSPERLRPLLETAYAAARTTWLAQGARICKVLAGAQLLKRQGDGYTDDNVARWSNELDELFAVEQCSFSNMQALLQMSKGKLAEMTRRNAMPPWHKFFDQADALVQLTSTAEQDLVLKFKLDLTTYARRELAARKASQRIQAFEDLLFGLDKALASEGGERLAQALQGQYRAALIDEFQDTDPVQFRIFRRIFHGAATLVVVGDPKQSIYAFRGADVFSYFQAAEDAGRMAHTLGTNHRSDPSLVRAVNTVFEQARRPFVFDKIAFQSVTAHATSDRIEPQRGAFEILFLARDPGQTKPHTKGDLNAKLPKLIAAEIARFLQSGAKIEGSPVRAGHVAVLTRTNDQARSMQVALRALGIPTALESEGSVFDSAEAQEVEHVLRAILDPTRGAALRSALATSIVGLSANAIVALETNEQGWQDWSERFRAIQDIWATRGFAPAFRKMLTELGVEPRLLSYVDGERRVTNLLHLRDLLHTVSRSERLGPSALVRWLAARRVGATDGGGAIETEAAELRLESDARAVKLLTIHKSKGLEYPVVYCPFLWATSPRIDDECLAFHDRSDRNALKLHFAPDDAAKLAAEEEVRAENQRLLYVALTRAKHRCSIVWGAINDTDESCLAYTLHPGRKGISSFIDAEIRKVLEKLASASKGSIVVRDLGDGTAPSYMDDDREGAGLGARAFDRRIDHWWRISSFSSMTSGAHASVREAEGVDRDEVDDAQAVAELAIDATPILLSTFPRGAKPGTLIHEVLEDYDFTATDDAALPTLVRAKLTSYGYPNDHEQALVQGLRAMIDTPLVDLGVALRSVPPSRRANELEFILPAPQTARSQFTTKVLAEAFAKHKTSVVPDAYATQLAQLGFLPLRGFLRGFVDLVFEHAGRFYVVDYKSNHLGDIAGAYAPARLVTAMSHANYFLQYHLYVIAVHRWLARRLANYDYERSFGGVLYLFARGMNPSHPTGTGIFFDRPKQALIQALSEALHNG